jgi:6-phosphofructokinase 1
MNAAVRAVVRGGIANGVKVFGVRRGYQGMIEDDIFEMGARDVGGIVNRGGTILFTARSKEF